MSKQKLSLEDILDEYSTDEKNSQSKTTGNRLETEKILNSADKINAPPDSKEEKVKRIIRNHTKSPKIGDGTLRRPNPANDVKPADLARSKVSFVNSSALSQLRSSKADNQSGYDNAVVTNTVDSDYTPKIRRMSDSTRAKEIEKIKKKHKKGRKLNKTYKKERPEGEYLYAPPKVKKRKRTESVEEEAMRPENQRLITDIVPSPKAVEAAKPVTPAPRAEKTSIDLSSENNLQAEELDIHITQETDYSKKNKTKRTKRLVDFNYYGDVEDVGRDIFELKSTISVRVFIMILTSFMSVYLTLAAQFKLPIIDYLNQSLHVRFFIAAQIIIGLISAVCSLSVFTNGFRKLFTLKADCDSMTALTSASCIIAALFSLTTPELVMNNKVHIYMPVGVLSLLFNALGKNLIITRAARNFNFVSKNFDRHGIVFVSDETKAESLTRGTLGDFPILASMRKTDFLTDFLRYTYSSDIADKFCKRAVPLCFIASLGVSGVLTYIRSESISFGFSIFSLLICASSCMAMSLVVNLPLDNASRKFIKNKGIMLGYQSVDDFFDTNSILINADKLFPTGSINLSGIKVFSDTKIDEALLEAASLTHYAGSVMQELFNDVIAGNKDILYPIENFSYEDSMGIGGWINNKRVLFGNRELMTSHYIEGMPTKTKETEFTSNGQEAVYLSISGNLSAMFIVDIKADNEVKSWIKQLSKRNIFLIIKSVDACITLKKISSIFNVPEEMMKVIPSKLHKEFDEETSKAVRLSASMACTGKFTSLAQLINGTKNVYSASIIGLIFQTASILLGFALCILLILSRDFSYDYMSATSLIAYNIICTCVTYFAVNMKQM